MNTTNQLVAGVQVQEDHSGGQGHCWKGVGACDLPANVVLEIEGEVIDGGLETCEDFTASNGCHYRW